LIVGKETAHEEIFFQLCFRCPPTILVYNRKITLLSACGNSMYGKVWVTIVYMKLFREIKTIGKRYKEKCHQNHASSSPCIHYSSISPDLI
jgi:hypothetical protein